MSDDARERNRIRREAEAADPGSTMRGGDYLGIWEKDEHPFGKPAPCPFCGEEIEYTELFYNGYGPPPSYAICCGNCGAQGPTSHGTERGDHLGARRDAVEQWNRRWPPTERAAQSSQTPTPQTGGPKDRSARLPGKPNENGDDDGR